MKIYVASSWRNNLHPGVVARLRAEGHEVYDFKNPAPDDNGFSWREIDPNWQQWTVAQYLAALEHQAAERGFGFDMRALRDAEATVLVMPCGRSAHLELGFAVGAGQRTAVLLTEGAEPELMYKMCGLITADIDELVRWLAAEAQAQWTQLDAFDAEPLGAVS